MRIIGWFGYLRYQLNGHEEEAMRWIAQLAGVDTGPDGQPLGLETPDISKLDTLGDGDILGLFTLPLSPDDPPP
jgi:hypothetical protein